MSETDQFDLVSMVRESASAVAPRSGDFMRIRALRFRSPGFDRATWTEMAGLGWIGMRLAENLGGVGLGMRESVALYEELGRGLVPEPLIAVTFAATLLAASSQRELLAQVLSGETLVATAWADSADAMELGATPRRRSVPIADAAEFFLLPWRSSDGAELRLVEASVVSVELLELQDGGRFATVQASPAAGRQIAGDIDDAFAEAFDEAALGTAAYLLGVAERTFEMTLEYLKQRKQFGQPLAAFQALQFRVVDLKIQLTLTRASVERAAADLDAGAGATKRAMVVSRAKARAAETALLIGREAIQLHGAIGFTDEYDVGLLTRKAMVVANQYGSAMAHRRRYLALLQTAEP